MQDGNEIKAGILTFHRADNYGALLQTKALLQVLLDKGLDAEIIDYRCAAIENDYTIPLFPVFSFHFIHWLRRLMINIYKAPRKRSKAEKCRKFRDNSLKMTTSVYSEADRKKIISDYQLIITGSDQIWNPKLTYGKDDWYAFETKDNRGAVIVSYGASVGDLYYFMEYFDIYRSALQNYDLISVREEKTKEFLEKRLNRSVYRVIDPTLLLSISYWNELCKFNKWSKENYIFYYDVEYNQDACYVAKNIAKQYNLRLLHYNASLHDKGSIYIEGGGPEEFLGLIKKAQYVITSSFHATVFSILFKKNFFVIPHPSTGDRVRDLLYSINLSDRIIEDKELFSISAIQKDIDYTGIDARIDALRIKSLSYIDLCIHLHQAKKKYENIEIR